MNTVTRRAALKMAALSLAGAPLLAAAQNEPAPAEKAAPKLKLGVATYSLNKYSAEAAIAILQELQIDSASLYHTHAPWTTGSVADCQAAVKPFKDAGITVISTGVIDLTTNEAAARKAFDNVRGAGLPMMCARPTHEALPLVEKLVKEYDLKVAIHNHGPTDLYPTGDAVWTAVESFDKRIGLCLDVGHAWRAGGDPAQTIRKASDRLYQVHLKDTRGPKNGSTKDPSPVIVGRGLMDIKGILAALLDVKYNYRVDFEYEQRVDDKVPGLAESVGYVRGLMAALS